MYNLPINASMDDNAEWLEFVIATLQKQEFNP